MVEEVLNLVHPSDLAQSVNRLIEAHERKEFNPKELIAVGSLCTYIHRKYTDTSPVGIAGATLHDLIDHVHEED